MATLSGSVLWPRWMYRTTQLPSSPSSETDPPLSLFSSLDFQGGEESRGGRPPPSLLCAMRQRPSCGPFPKLDIINGDVRAKVGSRCVKCNAQNLATWRQKHAVTVRHAWHPAAASGCCVVRPCVDRTGMGLPPTNNALSQRRRTAEESTKRASGQRTWRERAP